MSLDGGSFRYNKNLKNTGDVTFEEDIVSTDHTVYESFGMAKLHQLAAK